jgi:hypothetical protein
MGQSGLDQGCLRVRGPLCCLAGIIMESLMTILGSSWAGDGAKESGSNPN